MRLLVDGFNLGRADGTGVASYGRSFLRAVREEGHETALLLESEVPPDRLMRPLRKVADFLLAPCGYRPRPMAATELPATLAAMLPPSDSLWNRRRIFRAARGTFRRTGMFTAVRMAGIDVAHWTYPLPLFVPGARNIYTIHDIVPIKYPDLSTGSAEYRNICQAIMRRADHVLTVSERSRGDLIDTFGIGPSRISNTYQPLSNWQDLASRNTPPPSSAALLGRWKLESKGYFLFFGAIEPKKNIGRLLEAYAAADVGTPLVIVSGGGWDNAAEYAKLDRLRGDASASRVVKIDYLPRTELEIVIRHARATIFPSLYEGFGLPALESMSVGTAVITSDRGALPEIVGQDALLVDPLSTIAIRDAIRRIDGDAILRTQLEEGGKARAELFSADAYRNRVRDVLRRLDAGPD